MIPTGPHFIFLAGTRSRDRLKNSQANKDPSQGGVIGDDVDLAPPG
jgi:hypothetical protein